MKIWEDNINSTAPWCRILFDKLILTQLVKQYPVLFIEPEVLLL
jgi:hypothetical protein